jgi:ABC-type glycerol-3-phosphate transport system substrate-binding protein
MTSRLSRLFFTLLTILAGCLGAGCTSISDLIATPVEIPASPSPNELLTSTWLPATPSPSPQGPVRLRLWLPPFLSPASGDPAGTLLQKRLDEFQGRNPNVIIETRVKSLEGPGGLLDSLAASSAAAPASLPDLVALPRDLLEAAAIKGVLLPLDNLTNSYEDPDWYPYAVELAHLQSNVYGFPFAGDALVQVYRTSSITESLKSWSATLNVVQPLIFPAAAEDSLFTLAEYQANGGQVLDEQGRPFLNTALLNEVFTYYRDAVQAGVMPAEVLSQMQSDDQVWEAFSQNRFNLVITWSSHYLSSVPEGVTITQIPTPQGEPFSLASGWVWGLAGRDEARRSLAVDLAEFLTDSHFLADWSQAAGFLPARPSSLSLWSNETLKLTVGEIASSARLFPPSDVIASLAGPLRQATLLVLNGQADPASAAQTAASALTSP